MIFMGPDGACAPQVTAIALGGPIEGERMLARLLKWQILGSALIALTSGSIAFAQASPVEVVALLPVDGVAVDVMQPVFPKRMQDLGMRLQTALAKDPEWTKSHTAKAKPREPLPYDEKLGLTRAEYEEFLGLANKGGGGLAKVAGAKVRVLRDGDRVVLQFGKQFRGMEKIEVDLKKDTVSTPAGILGDRQAIAATPNQAATGPWDGFQWKSKGFEEDLTRPSVSLALGKLKATGRGILYYRLKPGTSGVAPADYVLFYDLRKSR